MTCTGLPSRALKCISADFLIPLSPGKYNLAVIDYYSRYDIAVATNSVTAVKAGEQLSIMFQQLATMFPNYMLVNNDQCFKDESVSNFLKTLEIHHHFFDCTMSTRQHGDGATEPLCAEGYENSQKERRRFGT
jgi:DeoR/GlpR family transcriptional regulator of sugar metabolism